MTENLTVLGIKIDDRVKEAGEVQKVLTQFGCSIKTRIGLHEVSNDFCSTSGLIILELFGPKEEQIKLHESLQKIQGTLIRKMDF
ncbi:MAG: hypothetical protein AB7S48_14700 [Bacteroidales bacterium]